MRRLILSLCAAVALSACTTSGGGVASLPPSPAILDATAADERALTLAANAVDAAALASSALAKAGVIQPGTPRAQRLARALDDARKWVNAAAAARAAGSSKTYGEAILQAGAALSALSNLLVEQ